MSEFGKPPASFTREQLWTLLCQAEEHAVKVFTERYDVGVAEGYDDGFRDGYLETGHIDIREDDE